MVMLMVGFIEMGASEAQTVILFTVIELTEKDLSTSTSGMVEVTTITLWNTLIR